MANAGPEPTGDDFGVVDDLITEHTPRGYDPEPLHGLPVRDAKGKRVGVVTAVYLDADLRLTEWAAVATRRLGRGEVLVPLINAYADDEQVLLPYARDHILAAPSRDPGATLSVREEEQLFAHYSIPVAGVTATAAGHR